MGVTPVTRMGNEFHLRDEDGDIVHRESGRSIHLVRRGGVYMMPMHFLVDEEPDATEASDFPRPGA